MQYIKRPWLGIVSLAFCGVMLGVQIYYDRPLKSDKVPRGIVSLELARDVKTTQQIFDAWKPEGKAIAIKGLYWDFGFLISYALLTALACGWAGKAMAGAWTWPAATRWGRRFAAAGIAAAFFDSNENASLLWQLEHGAAAFPAWTAWICASLKFSLLIGCGGFIAAGVIARWRILRSTRALR